MEQIVKEIRAAVKSEQTICLVTGNFNIVHPGHLRLLRFASEQADFLIVGVYSDRMGHVIIPEQLRLEGIEATSWVNYSFILDTPPEMFIEALKPDCVVKGKEHEKGYNPEKDVLDAYGGVLVFSSGDVTFSSIDLLKEGDLNEIKDKSHGYLTRHHIRTEDIQHTVDAFDRLKVIVVGETIVDEYVTCEAVGMSQEDPTIVVSPIHHESFLGAAGIVSAHAARLGAHVRFFSVIGDNDCSQFVREKIEEYRIDGHFVVDKTRPTIRKQRFRSKDKNLLRVNYLHQHDISQDLQNRLYDEVASVVDDTNLIIFSDFNYGCLPQDLVNRLSKLFQSKNKKVVADSQSSSQTGDVSRYKKMDLLTPTEREARLALNDRTSGLVVLAEKLRKKASAKNILITMGAEGLLIQSGVKNTWQTDRLPAFNKNPKDVSGAGDSFLACASLALAVTDNIWMSCYLGSVASGIQVSRLGNIPIAKSELIHHLEL
jgi:rfaE bifunctional protein kinase chain/domain